MNKMIVILFMFLSGLAFSLTAAEPTRFFIGTYTDGEKSGEGIYTAQLDPESGALSEPVLAAKCDNPSFLAMHPTKPRLYAVGTKGPIGMLYSFHYDKGSGRLTPLESREIPGRDPCHLALCVDEKENLDAVVIANYSSASVLSYPILKNGRPDKEGWEIRHEGQGPNASRQKEPHPHGAYFDGKNRTVCIPDLGIDKLVRYAIDLESGRLTPETKLPALELPPGGGPRHLATSKNGRFVYVNNEMTSTVCVFDLQSENAKDSIQEISTLPEDADASKNSTAEIELSRDGNFLYVSNRGHESIAVFKVDPSGGKLERIQNAPCGGIRPRFFALDPTGKFLLSCNKESGTITILNVDREAGTLTATNRSVDVGRPVCIVFAP